MRRRHIATAGAGIVAGVLALSAVSDEATATRLTVANTKPHGKASFAAAIKHANKRPDLDEIVFSRSLRGKIKLRHDVRIESAVRIEGRDYGSKGEGFKRLVLKGPHDGSILLVTGKHARTHDFDGLYLDRVAIGGDFLDLRPFGRIDVEDSFITGHGDVAGAGVSMSHDDRYADPGLKVGRSTIEGFETGVAVDSTIADIGHSVISGNVGGGGVVSAAYADIDVSNSTISGNVAGSTEPGPNRFASGGGARGGYYAGVDIYNSTVTGNSAVGKGAYGGAFAGAVEVYESTVTNNTAPAGGAFGGGSYDFGGEVILSNTIVAGNVATDPGASTDCEQGDFKSRGGNLIEQPGDCELLPTDVGGVDPMLGPLRDNGGPTPTQALLEGSPAIGLAVKKFATDNDQRGKSRGKDPDSGAYEFGG
jgi:hypothetical protein